MIADRRARLRTRDRAHRRLAHDRTAADAAHAAGRDRAPDLLLERQEHTGRQHEHEHPQRVQRRVVGFAQSAEREDLEAVGRDARDHEAGADREGSLRHHAARDRPPTRTRRRVTVAAVVIGRRLVLARQGPGASTPFPLVALPSGPHSTPRALGKSRTAALGWHDKTILAMHLASDRLVRSRGATHGEGPRICIGPKAGPAQKWAQRRVARQRRSCSRRWCWRACGSGTSSRPRAAQHHAAPRPARTRPIDKTLGDGVTPTTIKLGVALVDFEAIKQFTDTIRTRPSRSRSTRSTSTTSTPTAGSRAARSCPTTSTTARSASREHPSAVHVVRPGRQRVRGGRDVHRLLG